MTVEIRRYCNARTLPFRRRLNAMVWKIFFDVYCTYIQSCLYIYTVRTGLQSDFIISLIVVAPHGSYFYCMKPPNIKAPKCTLFSRVKGRKGSTVLPRLIASHCWGSLLRRAHFEFLRVAEAKNAATINHLMSKCQSVLYFPGSKVTRAHRSCHGSFRAS